ncbi:MAG: thioredoxin family protein, partial [Chloroflexus sp.]
MHSRLTLAIVLFVAVFISGCGRQAASPPAESAPIAPVIAASELVVGLNRLPFGLLQGGVPLNDPNLSLDVTLYYVGPGGDRTQTVTTA